MIALGVNLVILFDKRVRYVKKVNNHWARLIAMFDWVLGRTQPIKRLFWADTDVLHFLLLIADANTFSITQSNLKGITSVR